MGDLTKNISRHELVCKCGKCDVTTLDDEPVIDIVQDTCDYFASENNVDKVTLIITSAARCYTYNRGRKVGSNDNSQHPRARAIDFKIFIDGKQIDPQLVYNQLNDKHPRKLGLGNYVTFTHVDTRPNKARWSEV